MKLFKDIESFNEYLGLPKPLDNDIDIGYYNVPALRLQSEPVAIDFSRISLKSNFIDTSIPSYDPQLTKPLNAVFFNSPEVGGGWDMEPYFNGIYLQFSKKLIDENRFLFKNYYNYGLHEPLLLIEEEEKEIRMIFSLMLKYYEQKKDNFTVLISYVHVMVSLVESFYKRQFSTDIKQYSPIVSEFQQLLMVYYNQPISKTPAVQYFADLMGLTPNYLGDIIKQITGKTAIENIHEFVIVKAKEMLENRNDLNTTEIAFALGFEYPNYFSKFFKKQEGLTPKEYRLKVLKKLKESS
jgi:AraC-like DNA-binding protein